MPPTAGYERHVQGEVPADYPCRWTSERLAGDHGAAGCTGTGWPRPDTSLEHDFQLARSPDLSAGPQDLGTLGQMEDRDTCQPLLECDP